MNFVRTHDRNITFRAAKEKLQNNEFRVTEDLTRRVREDRRALAPTFADALKRGKQPKIRYDKLFIDGNVYKYDSKKDTVVCVSRTKEKGNPVSVSLRTNDEEPDERPVNTNTNLWDSGRAQRTIDLLCWNIEGLRKHTTSLYSDLKNFCSLYDIVGFCETFARDANDFVDFLDGYSIFNSVRTRKHKRGRPSGGVSVFVKDYLTSGGCITRILHDFMDTVVLLFKTSQLGFDKDMILVYVYIPPENSPVYDDLDTDGITRLSQYLEEITFQYTDHHLLVCGDLNARMRTFLDYIPNDHLQFVHDNSENYPTDNFEMPRNTRDDKHYNSFGSKLANLCCSFGIHALNGRLFNDTVGNLTCVTHNGFQCIEPRRFLTFPTHL